MKYRTDGEGATHIVLTNQTNPDCKNNYLANMNNPKNFYASSTMHFKE